MESADRFETYTGRYIRSEAKSRRGKVSNLLDHALYFLKLLLTPIRMRIIAMILQSAAEEQIANDAIVGALHKWRYMRYEECK